MSLHPQQTIKTGLCAILVFVLGLLSSCSVYHPQMVDMPLLTHKGDGHVDMGLSMQWLVVPTSMEANLSASYAPTDWLALQADGVYDFSRTGYGQAAVGFYHPWDKFVVEFYLGGGVGHAYSGTEAENNGQSYVEGDFNLAFAQLDLGWVSLLSGHLDLGLGLKGGFMFPEFTDFSAVNTNTGQRTTRVFTERHTLLEPQFMVRAGGEHLKMSLKVGLTKLNCDGGESQFGYTPLGVSLGLNYRF